MGKKKETGRRCRLGKDRVEVLMKNEEVDQVERKKVKAWKRRPQHVTG
jgi:hypothetical protein